MPFANSLVHWVQSANKEIVKLRKAFTTLIGSIRPATSTSRWALIIPMPAIANGLLEPPGAIFSSTAIASPLVAFLLQISGLKRCTSCVWRPKMQGNQPFPQRGQRWSHPMAHGSSGHLLLGSPDTCTPCGRSFSTVPPRRQMGRPALRAKGDTDFSQTDWRAQLLSLIMQTQRDCAKAPPAEMAPHQPDSFVVSTGIRNSTAHQAKQSDPEPSK